MIDIDLIGLMRNVRDQALEAAARTAEGRGAYHVASAIRSRQGDLWNIDATPAYGTASE